MASPPPNSRTNLDKAIQRLYGQRARFVEARPILARTIVGQLLPDAVAKGGGALQLRFGGAATRATFDFDAARRGALDAFVETPPAPPAFSIQHSSVPARPHGPLRPRPQVPLVPHAKPAKSATMKRTFLLLPLLALAAAARAEDPATNAPAALGSHDLASAKAAECAGFSACAAAGDVVASFATPNGVQPNGVQPAGATNEEQRSRNPGYTQELCEALWQTSSEGDTLRPADVARALEAVFDREREHYVFYVKQLTALQFRVLRALAQHGGREIYSAHFLEAANTVNRTSVKKAVAKIEKADLVYRHESEYRFVNPFFREWIKRGF